MAKKIFKKLKANPIPYVRTTSSVIIETEESCMYPQEKQSWWTKKCE